jgi:hypothetical protein
MEIADATGMVLVCDTTKGNGGTRACTAGARRLTPHLSKV